MLVCKQKKVPTKEVDINQYQKIFTGKNISENC
jgi:hypothetical protein